MGLYRICGLPLVIAPYFYEQYVGNQFLPDADAPSMLLLGPLFLLYWMTGCVSARRLRDCNFTGSVAMILAGVQLLYGVCQFFPDELVSIDAVAQAEAFPALIVLPCALNAMVRGIWLYCTLVPGAEGVNFFGRPFGPPSAAEQSRIQVQVNRQKRLDAEVHEIAGLRLRKPRPQLTTGSVATVSQPIRSTGKPRGGAVPTSRLQQATQQR